MTVRDGVRLETGSTKILANSAGYKPQVAPDLPGNLGGWEAGACVDSHVQSSVEWFPFYWGDSRKDHGGRSAPGSGYYYNQFGYVPGTYFSGPHGQYSTGQFEAVRIKNKMRIFSPTHGFNRTYNDRRGTLLNGINNSEGYWWIVYILPELARHDIMDEYPRAKVVNYDKLFGGGGQDLLEQIALTKIIVGFKTFQDIPPGMR